MNNPLAEAHQQQQEVAHRSYNPSQAQAYDQSYYGYYQYEQYSDPQHQYSYYSHPDYANAHQQRQEPSSSLHPPGVSIAPATTHMVDSEQTQVQNHPNSYYPQLFVGQQQQQHFVDPGSGALNPGNLGFQQQHWGGNAGGFGPVPVYGGPDAAHRPIGQSSHRGKSKRGSRSFRGGRGQAPAAQVPGTPIWPPPRMAWCELCRVDCNTSEILEKHKSGKKHKKNLQRFEELQNLNNLITGMPNLQMPQMPSPQIRPEISHPLEVDAPEEKQHMLPPEDVTDKNGVEIVPPQSVEQSVAEQSQETQRNQMTDNSDAQGRGFKRNLRGGGRGGKRMRINEWPRRPVEPPRPKVVIPLICEMCNIRCESPIVFESHLAGKKHHLNLKKFHGYRARGGAAHRALRAPNANAPSAEFIPQVNQGMSSQSLPNMLPNAEAPPALPQATAVCSENQSESVQDLSETDTKDVVSGESKGLEQSVVAKPEPPLAVISDSEVEKGSSESGLKVLTLPHDNNSFVTPTEGSSVDAAQVSSAQAMDKVVSYQEAGAPPNGVPSELDNKMGETEVQGED